MKPLLLARVAEELFWLGRHLERSECVARIVREHTNLLVDLPIDIDSDWSPLLAITSTDELYRGRYAARTECDVVRFLIADPANPGSIRTSMANARENLRSSRDLVPDTAWRCVNSLHRELVERAPTCHLRSERRPITDRIVESCQLLEGVLHGTMRRDNAYRFYRLGRTVERADMTTRVLDVRAGTLMRQGVSGGGHLPRADRSPYEDVRWLGVLEAVGAREMFHRSERTAVEGEAVVRFLLFDRAFPRSVAHCIGQIEELVAVLPPDSHLHELVRNLWDSTTDEPSRLTEAASLHDRVDQIQSGLAALTDGLARAYFARASAEAVATA